MNVHDEQAPQPAALVQARPPGKSRNDFGKRTIVATVRKSSAGARESLERILPKGAIFSGRIW
jgi:hypothetical protein